VPNGPAAGNIDVFARATVNGRLRILRSATLAIALLATASTALGGVADVAAAGHLPITLLPSPEDLLTFQVSDDGNSIFGRSNVSRYFITPNAQPPTLTTVPGDQMDETTRYVSMSASGRHLFAVTGSTTIWLRSETGAISSVTPAFPEFGWGIESIVGASPDGSVIAVNASNGGLAKVSGFLVGRDGVARTLPAVPASYQSRIQWMSADGARVRYAPFSTVGAPPERIIELDTEAGSLTEVRMPPTHDGSNATWLTSTDMQWSTSVHDNGLYIREVATGAETRVPAAWNAIEAYWLEANGRLVLSVATEELANVELFLWEPGMQSIQQLTLNASGEDPTYDVHQFHLTPDGSTLTFTHYGDDLAPDLPEGPQRRLYRMQLPPRPEARQVAIAASACVAATGASPAEFLAINITPINAEAPGFGTLHSSDEAAGNTSSVNFGRGTVDPNVTIAKVGADQQVCFTNSDHGPVDVILDAMLVGAEGSFTTPTPEGAVRLADTRIGAGGTRQHANSTLCVAAVGATPGSHVLLNVIAVGAVTPGFATVHSSDVAAGATSNVNFGPGTVDPNVAFAKVGTDGRVCITNSEHGPVDVVIDEFVVATAGTFTDPTLLGAVRLADTRTGFGGSRLGAGTTRCFIPVGAAIGSFVALNITPVLAITPGFATLHSSNDAAGSTSNVNFAPGSVDPNVGFAKVGDDGRICITNSVHGPVDVVVDQLVVGDPSRLALPTPSGSVRLLDTRIDRRP
jgi:hypothetical protein